MMKYVETSSTGTHSVGYTYDSINNLTKLVETIGTEPRETSYTYDEDNRPTSINTNGVSRSYTYDKLGRVSKDSTKQNDTEIFERVYAYQTPSGGGTSNVLYGLSYDGVSFDRSFMANRNANGNIVYTLDGTNISTYQYDSANQLIRENNIAANTTTIWTYDNAGNILTREVYPRCSGTPDPSTRISVVNYTYGDSDWGDLLTEYNGVEITHDEIGNPLNDGTWSYTWQHGRQLASMAKSDQSESWQFTYNADGMRTQRKNTVTNLTYNYTYLGGQLTRMTVGEHTLYFAYDAAGVPLAMTYDGENYYYVTTIQGDVVSILNASGTEVVRYIYDAWGNLLSTTGTLANPVGFYNPLRYRGYVYDAETGLYYLQSRYYNPEMGRFVNADGFASTGQGVLGNNMFAYCGNSPILRQDISGTRYCEATSIVAESSEARSVACQFQGKCAINKPNQATPCIPATPKPQEESTSQEVVKQVTKSVWNNLELSVGFGHGLYYEGTAFDLLDFGIGMYGTSGTFYLSEGKWYCGQEFTITAYGGLFGHNFGYSYYSLTPYDVDPVPIESKFFFNDDTWTISSGSIYFMGGVSYRIGFDIVQFIYDMNRIFE